MGNSDLTVQAAGGYGNAPQLPKFTGILTPKALKKCKDGKLFAFFTLSPEH